MLPEPKGIKYWIETDEGTTIDPQAPEWAKQEFKEYMDFMAQKPDSNGIIRQ